MRTSRGSSREGCTIPMSSSRTRIHCVSRTWCAPCGGAWRAPTRPARAPHARVLVPVRRNFEAAIQHYLANGLIWDGGDVPTVDDPLYVSIADEMKEAAGHFEGAKIVDQWPVKLPTSFVIIDDPGNPAVLPD